MKAVTRTGDGGTEVLRWSDVPDPVAGPGEVVLTVAASAVNRADLLQRQGHYAPPEGASEILGLECSGTVAAIGAGVDSLAVGDEVCALLTGGGYAEQVAVPAGQCMPLPPGVDLVTAGSIPEVACTVHANVVMSAHLQAAETLLVHGGSSGIGTFAIQYAVALGARVAVTAGSADKLERCRELGASILVNYREQDFVDQVGAADVILDNMGAKYLDRNIRALAPGGRLVTIGLQGGSKAELNLGLLLSKRASVAAASLRARPTAEKSEICQQVAAQVWPMYGDGRIHPVVDCTFPMSEVAKAHEHVDASGHVGKVVLLPQ